MTRSKTRMLTECSIMIALASVLSVLKLVDMPVGGSVTPASMLPILLFAYRHGTARGLLCATLYGVMQQLLGLETLSYVSGPVSIVTLILLDYILAYTAVGLGGLFRRLEKNQSLALLYGAVLVSLLRYICHVISGFTVWNEMQMPDAASITYSLSYNATYMLPETIILVAAAAYIGMTLDLRQAIPTRISTTARDKKALALRLIAGLLALACVVFAILQMTPFLQNAETGEFFLRGLASANWALILSVCLPCAVASLCLFIAAYVCRKKNNLADGN